MSAARRIDADTIMATTRIRLATAAALAFPEGNVSAKWLQSQGRRGLLDIWRIAGKDFTTLDAIERMLEECRAQPSRPASISESGQGVKPSSSSSIAEKKSALAAAQAASMKLKQSSADTLPKSIPPTGATVIPLKSA